MRTSDLLFCRDFWRSCCLKSKDSQAGICQQVAVPSSPSECGMSCRQAYNACLLLLLLLSQVSPLLWVALCSCCVACMAWTSGDLPADIEANCHDRQEAPGLLLGTDAPVMIPISVGVSCFMFGKNAHQLQLSRFWC